MLFNFIEKFSNTSISRAQITGGEPLLVDYLGLLVSSIAKCGISVSIGTNGTLLTSDKISSLAQAGLNKVRMTLHSHIANTHEKLANGGKNTFTLLRKAIDECLINGLKVIINFPVSVRNIDSASETLAFIDGLGVNAIRILFI
jgi:molybdenum cofactor biosynthesis enzyme MoaA